MKGGFRTRPYDEWDFKMNLPNYKPDYISEQDYLEHEKISETKHEYFDGEIFAMAGASRSHQRIISNLVIDIGTHLKIRRVKYLAPI